MTDHRRLLACQLLVGLSIMSSAQVEWMRQGGLGGHGRGVSHDDAGNVYVAGLVNAPALFDADTVAAHFADVFIAKYDPAGSVQWIRTGGNELIDQANDIITDAAGNSYVTGFFRTNALFPSVEFDGQSLSGQGSSDLFVAKYDVNGALHWIRTGGGPLAEEGRGVALLPSGNIVVSGYFQGTAYFSGDTLESAGASDVLLLCYSSTGELLWSQRDGGPGDDRANKLTSLSNGDVALVGSFQQTATIGGDQLSAAGLGDLFVARYDESGNGIWAARAGSDVAFAQDEAFDIDTANNGDLLVCGEVAGVSDFTGQTITPNGGIDLFVARYGGDGLVQWVHHAGGPQADHAYGISTDEDSNVYVTGQVDDGANTVFDDITLDPFGNESVFLAKYGPSGDVLWVRRYAPGLGGAVDVLDTDCLLFTGGASGIVGQPAFDAVPWQYVDRAIFTARFCGSIALGSTQAPPEQVDLSLRPNPACSEVYVDLLANRNPAMVELMDASGRVLITVRQQGPVRMDVSGLPSGVYAINAVRDGHRMTRRLDILH